MITSRLPLLLLFITSNTIIFIIKINDHTIVIVYNINAAENGVFRSINSGVNWAQSSSNTPTGPGETIFGIASSVSGQIMVAAVDSNGKQSINTLFYV